MKVKKLQRLIEKELEKKRNRGKRSHSVSSMSVESEVERECISVCSQIKVFILTMKFIYFAVSSIGSPANESEELLKDIIEDTLNAENEIDKVVAKSTVEILSDVCEQMKNENEPEPSTSKGLGKNLFECSSFLLTFCYLLKKNFYYALFELYYEKGHELWIDSCCGLIRCNFLTSS